MSAQIHSINDSIARLDSTPAASECADLVLLYLEQIGVEYVFGIPGGAIEPLYNALARRERQGGIRAIVSRHETGAALMAEGYSRNSGRLGVCCSTAGPGATNLITGVASAYENQVPLLVITAQTALSSFGRKALQESSDTAINTVGMFQHCCHYNTLVSHSEQLEHKLASAIMTAFNAAGPAHLSIPLDLLAATPPSPKPRYQLSALLTRPHTKDDDAIASLVDLLQDSRKPVFVLGSGCQDAVGLILRVAATMHAQVITTPDGKGLINPFHPNYRGVLSFAGHKTAQTVIEDPEVDLVITVGNMLGEWGSNNWDGQSLLTGHLVHIESHEANLTRSPMAMLHVRGSIDTVFETVIEELGQRGTHIGALEQRPGCFTEDLSGASSPLPYEVLDLDRCLDASAPVKPQWLMTKLTQLFPPTTRFLADSGNSFAWAIHYLHPYDRRLLERRQRERGDNGRRSALCGLFQAGFEFAPMGWAIGNSIGTALANPNYPVVCITGDGSMLMSGQEITVARQHQLNVIFVILNDEALGMVRHGQRLGGGEPIGYELPAVDFRRLGEAMGIRGYLIRTPQDLLGLNIGALCEQSSPTILDVRIDPEQVPPIGQRLQALHNL